MVAVVSWGGTDFFSFSFSSFCCWFFPYRKLLNKINVTTLDWQYIVTDKNQKKINIAALITVGLSSCLSICLSVSQSLSLSVWYVRRTSAMTIVVVVVRDALLIDDLCAWEWHFSMRLLDFFFLHPMRQKSQKLI